MKDTETDTHILYTYHLSKNKTNKARKQRHCCQKMYSG